MNIFGSSLWLHFTIIVDENIQRSIYTLQLFKDDHATCTIDLGLAMIDTMKVFDSERHENIQMRVGIHTGNFLKLVKILSMEFIVWSLSSKFNVLHFR